jgi:hypothetical protein
MHVITNNDNTMACVSTGNCNTVITVNDGVLEQLAYPACLMAALMENIVIDCLL